MPHIDSLLLRQTFTARGQSRFARPVASVTALVRRLAGLVASETPPVRPRGRQDRQVRDLEEQYSRAVDLPDLERMERDFERRDGGGMRAFDWR